MTARLISVSPTTLQPVSPWLSQSPRKSTRRASKKRSDLSSISSSEPEHPSPPEPSSMCQDALLAVLLEAIQEGVMVVSSTTLQPIYCNQPAKALCQQLGEPENCSGLPTAIAAVCDRFLQEQTALFSPLVAEFQGHPEQFIRVKVQWLGLGGMGEGATSDQFYLLIQLEDCYAALKEELALEKKKYELTGREAEVWIMMRQKYSYQEIAEILTISMNTVKTHVKNVNAKRKSLMGDRQVWYSR